MSKKQERLVALQWQEQRVQRRMDGLERRNRQLWRFKFIIAILGTVVVITIMAKLIWLFIPAICLAIGTFLRISSQQRKVNESLIKYRTLQKIITSQIARLQLDWENIPQAQASIQADHPFNPDLDITGDRSLHQLINTGVSIGGQQRLGDWLLAATPDITTIRARQDFIHELTPLTRFREKLLLNSLFVTRYISTPLEGQKLLIWLEAYATEKPLSSTTLIIPGVLSVSTICTLCLFLLGKISVIPCLILLLLSLLWYLWTRRKRGTLSKDVSYLRNTFGQLQVIFDFLEKYPYGQHFKLKQMCEPFFSDPDQRPSVLLRRLTRITWFALIEDTELFGLFINTLIPLDITIAYLLGLYRERIAQRLPIWLEIWYELEALSSLANFAYLNPDYSTPELDVDPAQTTTPHFEAYGLGHPLIEDDKKVVNDFTLGSAQEIILITGSNMAGKSSFLRTLGINLILAYAGGPVNATVLRCSLFEIYACIRVTDSVIDGYSYFYAEVRRLKGLLTRLQQDTDYPIFFFIDEIFKGTNNRERLIGSISYIQAITDKNCVGAISTHDLELVKLSETLPQIKNYHFREEIVDEKMVFTYKLRQGPSPTTNALTIMELEGLPVNRNINLAQ